MWNLDWSQFVLTINHKFNKFDLNWGRSQATKSGGFRLLIFFVIVFALQHEYIRFIMPFLSHACWPQANTQKQLGLFIAFLMNICFCCYCKITNLIAFTARHNYSVLFHWHHCSPNVFWLIHAVMLFWSMIITFGIVLLLYFCKILFLVFEMQQVQPVIFSSLDSKPTLLKMFVC